MSETITEKHAVRLTLREDETPHLRDRARELALGLGLKEITSRILVSRGIDTAEAAKRFLYPSLREHVPDPAAIKSINKAVSIIVEAVKKREIISILCDFDVDGLTAGSQLLIFLRAIGAQVNAHVPNRFSEGYGLSESAVRLLAETGTKLLITADCGIGSVKQIKLAKSLGIKTIVLDHHEPDEELPPADAIVDPAQEGCPFQEHRVAAAGLVWLLIVVLRRNLIEAPLPGLLAESIPAAKDFLDLAAMGTICDMVPLVGLNRVIAYRGIEAIRRSERPGVKALINASGLKVDQRFGCGQVSFGLGPRINAAGRLGDARMVLTMLTTTDEKKASSVASKIDKLNEQRKTIEDAVRQACLATLKKNPKLLDAPALAVYGAEFHQGVIGIAAQRLVEEFYKPTAVMAPGEALVDGQKKAVIKGSVRSIPGFHVSNALQSLGEILVSCGGHAQAGGFTLLPENLSLFQQSFIDKAEEALTAEHLVKKIKADVRAELSAIDFELAIELATLSPFGVANPSPILVSEKLRIDSVTMLGDKHLRVRFSDDTCTRNAVCWRMSQHPLLRKGKEVSVAYQVELNTYKGISSVQLNVKDVW